MSLVVWWKLDNLEDSSGNNNNLSYQLNSGKLIANSSGKIGSCYERQVANDGADYFCSDKIISLPGDFTFATWAYVTGIATSTAAGLVSHHNHATNMGAGINVKYISDTDYRICCSTGNGTSRTYHSYYGTSNIKNKWSHLLLKFEKATNTLSLWVDGVQEYTMTYAMVTGNYNLALFAWSLGTLGLDYRPAARLNDVRIYDHALSTKEVKELAKAKVLHYKFDQFEEPTTNLVTNTNLDTGWDKGYCTGILWNNILPPYGIDSPVVSFYDSNTDKAGYWYSYGDFTPQNPNTTYTVSLYVRTLDSNFKISFYTADNAEVGRYISEYKTVPAGEWYRVIWDSFTSSSDATSDSLSFQFSYGNVQGETQRTWLCAPQMEAKDHATPYVYGSRTGTVLDSSGYENHAELGDDAPQWVSDVSKVGYGAYRFDGTDNITTNKLFLDNTNQCHTVSAWVYPTNPAYAGNQQLVNFNLGYRLYHSASGQSLMYNNSGTYDHYVYGSVIPSNTWTFVTWVYDNANLICKVYYNGVLNASSSNFGSGDIPSGFSLSTVFGSNYVGYIDDVRVYATALSGADIQELYSARYSLDENGRLSAYKFTINGLAKSASKIAYHNWKEGDYSLANKTFIGDLSSHSMTFSRSNNFSTKIIQLNNPVDSTDLLLEYKVTATHYTQYSHPTSYYYFTFDKTKTYRYSQWIYRHTQPSASYSSRCYLGIQGNTVCGLNTTTLNNNPYFTSPTLNDPLYEDKWVLQVFYVYPYGSTGNPAGGKLYYTNGSSVTVGTAYNWADVTSSHIRQYPMYEYSEVTEGTYVLQYRPRLDLIDGTEPSIDDLISCTEHLPLINNSDGKVSIFENGNFLSRGVSECGITDGLVAWWPLNRNAMDITEYANDGIVIGATVAQGQGQSCYSLDGVDDYIDISTVPFPSLTSCSMSFWIKLNSVKDWLPFTGQTTGYYIMATSGGTGAFYHDSIGTPAAIYGDGAVKTTPFADVNWHHYVITGINLGTWTKLYIDKYSSAWNWGGLIQDVRIYDRALSEQEVRILYNSTRPETPMSISDNGILYVKSISEI